MNTRLEDQLMNIRIISIAAVFLVLIPVLAPAQSYQQGIIDPATPMTEQIQTIIIQGPQPVQTRIVTPIQPPPAPMRVMVPTPAPVQPQIAPRPQPMLPPQPIPAQIPATMQSTGIGMNNANLASSLMGSFGSLGISPQDLRELGIDEQVLTQAMAAARNILSDPNLMAAFRNSGIDLSRSVSIDPNQLISQLMPRLQGLMGNGMGYQAAPMSMANRGMPMPNQQNMLSDMNALLR